METRGFYERGYVGLIVGVFGEDGGMDDVKAVADVILDCVGRFAGIFCLALIDLIDSFSTAGPVKSTSKT